MTTADCRPEGSVVEGRKHKKAGEKTDLLSNPQGNFAIYGELPWYYLFSHWLWFSWRCTQTAVRPPRMQYREMDNVL